MLRERLAQCGGNRSGRLRVGAAVQRQRMLVQRFAHLGQQSMQLDGRVPSSVELKGKGGLRQTPVRALATTALRMTMAHHYPSSVAFNVALRKPQNLNVA